MTIFCYERDAYGYLPVFDGAAGRYRFLTEAERAERAAQEMAHAERIARQRAMREERRKALGLAVGHSLPEDVPHEMNCNRVSYGRSDPDKGYNWPQHLDGKCP